MVPWDAKNSARTVFYLVAAEMTMRSSMKDWTVPSIDMLRGKTQNPLLVVELWLRLRLAAAPLLCWLNACCGLWMTACAVPALLTHDP